MSSNTHDAIDTLLDPAGRSVDEAIRSSQHAASAALDGMADAVQALRREIAPLIGRTADEATDLTHRGLAAVKDASHQVRAQAEHASERTLGYIRAEPVKATLIAAATGAALMGVVCLMSRTHARH